ncbi:MAG: ATP-binding protein [Anaerolineales bacterium]|nr:ATP-binding protein [Anaerolineales bacterium]
MDISVSLNWLETNQRYLSAELERIRARLEQRLHGDSPARQSASGTALEPSEAFESTLPALISLCNVFKLTPFERDILLLCAGAELDSRFSMLCAAIQNDPSKPYPTFSLALSVLSDVHWSALSQVRPLRYWRLIEVGSGNIASQIPLRIDERILHYLTGTSYLDERLAGYVRPVVSDGELPDSHAALAQRIVKIWSEHPGREQLPIIQLCGSDISSKHNTAVNSCARLGMNLYVLPAHAVPSNPFESESLRRLWQRESALNSNALLLDCNELDNEPAQNAAIQRWIENSDYPLIVSSRERRLIGLKHVISFDVHKPTTLEQQQLWQNALGPAAALLNGRLEALVSHFNLDSRTIYSIAAEALQKQTADPNELGRALWEACSNQAHPRLGELAQHIRPMARWEDLVLPETQLQSLHDIARQIRQRLKVYETWGFASKSARGLGISALFAGVSGTGKTMSAEVLANELGLELYRIDLSQVISKYIGETEKNLRRVFDAAEESSAVLLFDEADALFGKRSEVKDSHDRYANIEVSYLLQRMEEYRGLAILTTNMKEALDQAFLRRIRFVIQFPFPDINQRSEIWKRAFPSQTPTEGLDVYRLAKLNVTGGNIRNIALHAAFLAADSNQPVRMDHLLRGARVEFAKLEKPLTESEIGGWA